MNSIFSKPFIKVKNWSWVTITGQDATTFLQGQISINTVNLADNTHNPACYLDIKGRITAFFECFKINNETYHLWMPKEIIETFITTIKPYALFSKVTIEPAAIQTMLIINNEQEIKTLCSALNIDNSSLTPGNIVSSKEHHCNIVKTAYPNNIFMCFSSKTIENNTLDLNNLVLEDDAYQALLMQNGYPVINHLNTGQYLPLTLNMLEIKAVDLKKGCYLGQEIVARMHFRSQIKKRCYALEASSELTIEVNSKIQQNGKNIGQVVGLQNYQQKCYILAELKIDTNWDQELEFSTESKVAVKRLNLSYGS